MRASVTGVGYLRFAASSLRRTTKPARNTRGE